MEVFLGFSWIIFVFSAHSVRVSIVYELGFFWEKKKKKRRRAPPGEWFALNSPHIITGLLLPLPRGWM